MSNQRRREAPAGFFTTYNPVLDAGEEGVEVDTGLFKTGDGATPWSLLSYTSPSITQLDSRYLGKRNTGSLGGSKAPLQARDFTGPAPDRGITAETVTTTLSANGQSATTIAGGLAACSFPNVTGVLTLTGTNLAAMQPVAGATSYYQADWKADSIANNAVSGIANAPSWGVLFTTDATDIEFSLKISSGGGFAYQLVIDGLPLTNNPSAPVVVSGGTYVLKFSFTTPAVRRIQFQLTKAAIQNLYVNPFASINAVTPRGPRWMAFGDSFVQGSTMCQGGEIGTGWQRVGRMLGAEDVWVAGVGSTGFINNAAPASSASNQLKKTYIQRISEITACQPDVLVVEGWFNDRTVQEVQYVTVTATGGSAAWTIPGVGSTAAQAFNVATATLQTALQALIPSTTVAGTAGVEYYVKFPASSGAVGLMTIGSGLTGGTATPVRALAGGLTSTQHATAVGAFLDAVAAAMPTKPLILVVGATNVYTLAAYEANSVYTLAPDDISVQQACQARQVPYCAPSSWKVWDGAGVVIYNGGKLGCANTNAWTVSSSTGQVATTNGTSHLFVVGMPFTFESLTSVVGLAAGVTYYVQSVIDYKTVLLSATPGGSAITAAVTVGGTGVGGTPTGWVNWRNKTVAATAFSTVDGSITTTAAHGLAVNEPIGFATLTGVTGLTAGTTYFVQAVPTSTTFIVSATQGGSAIIPSVGGTGTIGLLVGWDSTHPTTRGNAIRARYEYQAITSVIPA